MWWLRRESQKGKGAAGNPWLLPLALSLSLVCACREEPGLADLERVLTASWQSYVQHSITPEGRVAVSERAGETISEAQAYALLRAVWAGDAATFARVYAWTRGHLSRADSHGDHLLAWRWGLHPDGSLGVLDANTASDADLDYALALTLAARRGWGPPPDLPDYLEESRRVQAAILAQEVVHLPTGEALLTPGNWHEANPPYLVNPSYFSPAAYRLFTQAYQDDLRGSENHLLPSPLRGEGQGGGGKNSVQWSVASGQSPDGKNTIPLPPALSRQGRGRLGAETGWGLLHKSTYQLLDRLTQGLGGQPGVGLIPDWCQVDAQGRGAAAPGRGSDFGWEAVRLPFRVALDYLWFKEETASRFLARQLLPFFKREWQAHGRLAAVYRYDGTPAAAYDSPVLYAGVLAAALAAGDQDFAQQLAQKVLSFYQEKDGRAYFVSPDHYYANNWAWLGLALYAGWVRPF